MQCQDDYQSPKKQLAVGREIFILPFAEQLCLILPYCLTKYARLFKADCYNEIKFKGCQHHSSQNQMQNC